MGARSRSRYIPTGFLALDPKAFGQEFLVVEQRAPEAFEMIGGVAVISIDGPLEQHPNWCWQDYETIEAQARAAFASSAGKVALRVNSPGGAAAGCFELARALRAMALEAQKPLGVFVDGMAASAAYAIACAATGGIWAPQTSRVASLAVYEMMVDQTALDAAQGLRFLVVPSTGADLKLTGNPHIVASAEQIEHTQAQVDELTDYFYGLVEEMRGVSQETVRALRGATLLASQGAAKGLVDEIGDWKGFLAHLDSHPGEVTTMGAQAKAKSPFDDALASLQAAADGDEDEEKKARARKMLAAHYADEDGGGPPSDKKPEPEGRAEAEPSEDEKAKAATAEDEKKAAAQARAASPIANELALAQQVQELRAEMQAQKDAGARAALLAKRPDFSAEQIKTLAKAPLPVLEDAVKTWPRLAKTDTRAAAASEAQPPAVAGKSDGAVKLAAHEQSILEKWGSRPNVTQARVEGTSLVLDQMSGDAAAKRMKEMVEQGLVPKGIPHDMARISNTEFKVQK